MRILPAFLLLAPALAPALTHAATLTVGPGKTYPTLAAAIAASQSGDTIAVSAGTYVNDTAEIAHPLTLQAVGGRVTLMATALLPNRKAILITDTDTTITGFTFEGARISNSDGQNGAGIRYQGGNLVLSQCWFRSNQEGLLADATPTGTITITQSEFNNNGDVTGPGAGYTHNLYVNVVQKLDIEKSYFHAANVGHEIKSRALTTIINNTRVVDGQRGTASYSIDLPNAGAATITNNQIQQGPLSENPSMISYGEEGNLNPSSSLRLTATTLENNLTDHVPTGVTNATAITAALSATSVYGLTQSQLIAGPAVQSQTTYLATEPVISTQHPWLLP